MAAAASAAATHFFLAAFLAGAATGAATTSSSTFGGVAETTRLRKKVPLHFSGEENSVAVKTDKCLVNHVATEIEIECLATQLPEFIAVDLSGLVKGQSLHATDLVYPEGIKFVRHGKVNPVIVAAVPPKVEEEAAPAPAAAPAKKAAAKKAAKKPAAPAPAAPAAAPAAPAKTTLNPAAAWPFPTGNKP